MDPYEARNGVVYIYSVAYNDQGQSEAGWGTGWAIGKPGEPVQYIVTNGHVVERAYAYPKQYANITGDLKVYFSAAENDFVAGQVVYYSGFNEKDIAIIKLPSATDKRTALRLRSSSDVKVGETVYALGYPGTATVGQDFKTYNQDDITLTRGVISKKMTPNFSTYSAFQMDTYISGGNSGGPLVDENGFVVGINSAGIEASGIDIGMNYAIVADELIKILDSERIEYTMAGGGGFLGAALVCLCVPAHRRAGAGRRHHPAGNVPEERSGRPSSCRRCRRYGIWKSACKRQAAALWKNGLCCAA